MKKYISLLIIGLVVLSCKNETNIKELYKLYPEADAVYVEQNKSYVLNEDGSVDFHYRHKLAYLTHYSFNSMYGETFILINPDYQTLTINKCETLTPDGRIVEAPENAFNEVLPRNASNAPAYNNLIEMVVSHTALEVGAIVTLDYTIHSKSGYSQGLFGTEVLSSASPVQKMNFEISVPESTALNYSTFNIEEESKIKEKSGVKTIRWELNEIAAEIDEPLSAESVKPCIVFSTENLLTEMSAINSSLEATINPTISDWAETVEVGNSNKMDAVFAIQKAIVNDLNTYHPSLKQTAYKYRNSLEVFNSNGGTEIEKTLLFANILQSMDFDAKVVATIPAWMGADSSTLNLDMVSNFYVRVPVEDKTLYLSAIAQNSSDPTNIFDGVLLIDDQTIGLMKATENEINVRASLTVSNAEKLEGELLVSVSKALIDDYRLLQDEKSLKHILSLGVEKQKIDTNTSDEVIVTLDLNMTTIKQIKDVYYTLPIPYVKSGLDKFKTSFNTSERKTLLHFPSLIVESYTYDIKLDKDWTLVNKDVNIVEKNELAEMQIKISQENKGEVIQVNKTFKLLKQDITTEEYPQLEKMLSIWYDNKYQDLKLR